MFTFSMVTIVCVPFNPVLRCTIDQMANKGHRTGSRWSNCVHSQRSICRYRAVADGE